MEKKEINAKNIIYSSTVSSVFVSIFCTPLDVVKNYIQYNSSLNNDKKYIIKDAVTKRKTPLLNFNSLYYQTLKGIYRQYGVKSVYKGLLCTTNLYMVNNTLFFYVYEEMKEKNIPCYISAIVSRFLAIIVTAPLELYRTNIQANVCNSNNVNFFTMFKKDKTKEVKINLYKGISSTLMRDIPFSALYWSLNEYLIKALRKKDSEFENNKKSLKKFVYPFICGCVSSIISTCITHPLDIIKTNLQARCIDVIHKSEFDYKKIKNYDAYPKMKFSKFSTICTSNFYSNLYDIRTNTNYVHNSQRFINYNIGTSKYGCNTYNNKYYNYFKITNDYNLNIINVAKCIFQKNGIKGFYIGIIPRLVKIVPTCAIIFSTHHYFNY